MSNVRFRACVRWMSGLLKRRLSSQRDEEHLVFLQIIETIDEEKEHDSVVIQYLSSPTLYWSAYRCILGTEEPRPQDQQKSLSFWPLIHALARQGIYLVREDETSINHSLLASVSPFNKEAHCLLMEGLMSCYVTTLAPTKKVVKEIRLSFGLNASKELPYSTEEALLLWINKASVAAFTRHQRLIQEISMEENPAKKREARLRLVREGGALVEPCEKADSIDSLSDGQCVASTLIYYKLRGISWKDFHFSRQLLSPEFSLSNLRAVCHHCNSFLVEPKFHVPPEDWLLHPQELRMSLLCCLALLFDSLTRLKEQEAKKPPLGLFNTKLPRILTTNNNGPPFKGKMHLSSLSDPGFNFSSQKVNSTLFSHSFASNPTPNLSSISSNTITNTGLHVSTQANPRRASTPNRSLQSVSLPSIQNPAQNRNNDFILDEGHHGNETQAHGSVDSGMEMGIAVNETSSGRTEEAEESPPSDRQEHRDRTPEDVGEEEIREEECGKESPKQEENEVLEPLSSEGRLFLKVFPDACSISRSDKVFETSVDAFVLRAKVRSKMREIKAKLDKKRQQEVREMEQIKRRVLFPSSAVESETLPEKLGGRQELRMKENTRGEGVNRATWDSEQRDRRKEKIRLRLEERDRERRSAAIERRSSAKVRRGRTWQVERAESPQGRGRSCSAAVSRTILLESPTEKASAGQNKSNKKLIRNALCFVCLAGEANITLKQKALAVLEASTCSHFYILFRDTLGLKFKGLYTLPLGDNKIIRIFGTGPKSVQEPMVKQFFKYNSGAKSFQASVAYSFSISMDAVTIQDHCWNSGSGKRRRSKLS